MRVEVTNYSCLHKALTLFLTIKLLTDLCVEIFVVFRSGGIFDNVNVSVFSNICRPVS